MNIAAITKQVQQHSSLTAHPLAASPFAQKQKHPFIAETVQGKQGSILNQIADRMVDKFEKSEALESRIKKQEMMLEEYTSIDSDSALEKIEPEVLEMYLAMFELSERTADWSEKNLTEFRDNLKVLDQRIQSYQDIIDDTSGSVNGRQKDDAVRLLANTKETRKQYLQEYAAYFNKFDGESDYSSFDHVLETVYGENPFAKKQASDWMIDISADDIYAEIDRVIGNVRSTGQVFKSGCARILRALEKLGYGEYKYQHYKAMMSDSMDDERITYAADLLEKAALDTSTKRQIAAQQNPAKYQQTISLV